MLKLISWKFSDIQATELAVGDHIFLSKGQWPGLQFSISGLGLSKLERDFFETKFLEIRNVVNIYLGRFIVSVDKKGLDDHFHSVKIIKTESIRDALKRRVVEMKDQLIARYHKYLNKRLFNKLYEFQIDKYYEGTYRFKSDMLSAFQLASNYEADLIWQGEYIFSPLGFSFEENRDLIVKYLGKRFITKSGSFNLREYKHHYDPEIRNYKRVA
jgi:hypothetical protein